MSDVIELQSLIASVPGEQSLVTVPVEFQIFPAGKVSIEGDEPFLVDDAAMDQVTERFKARGLDMVIDYEHQTEEGTPAPAAGWIKALENRGKDGLWAKVEWTEKAREYLANREYRYFSPVFLISRTERRLLELLRVALTNAPRLNRIRPIVAKSGEKVSPGSTSTHRGKKMLVETIAEQLGLPEGSGEKEVTASIARLMKQSARPAGGQGTTDEGAEEFVAGKDVLAALGLPEKSGKSEIIATIHALRQKPDLSLDVASLKRRLAERDRDEMVNAALKEGKITPAQKEWAATYALDDPEGFSLFVAKAPRVVPIEEINLLGDGRSGSASDSEDVQMHINKLMGIGEASWKKYGSGKN